MKKFTILKPWIIQILMLLKKEIKNDHLQKNSAFLKENCRPPIPEVIISGYADADKYEEAQALGVSAYLFKPFENEEFLKVIETITHAGD